MPNLLPIGYEDEIVTAEELGKKSPIGYRSGVAFDYVNGDFQRDGMYKMLSCNGIESWKSWIINCIQTERYKHLAYSSNFGIELDQVFRAKSRDEAESILTREISEAIMADPYKRTEYIEDIEFDWITPDTVVVSVTVQGIEDVTVDIRAIIKGGTR